MAQRVGIALRLKPDKLKAFSESGDNRDVMTEFLDKEREVRCYVLEGKGLQVVRESCANFSQRVVLNAAGTHARLSSVTLTVI